MLIAYIIGLMFFLVYYKNEILYGDLKYKFYLILASILWPITSLMMIRSMIRFFMGIDN